MKVCFLKQETNESRDCLFKCLVCNSNILLQRSQKGIMLSNATRHIGKRCWLKLEDYNPKPAKVPKCLDSFFTNAKANSKQKNMASFEVTGIAFNSIMLVIVS